MYVVDTSTVRRVDAASIERGTSGYTLMQTAGKGAAGFVLADEIRPRGTVVVVCGKGNNGGDGLVVARELHLASLDVVAAVVSEDLEGDAATALADARDCGVLLQSLGSDPGARLRDLLDEHPGSHLVDGLFGTGLRLPLREPYDAVAATMRDCGRRVIALDGPSGLDGDTGELDPHAPVAAVTVSFGLLKWGMVLEPGRAHCGRIELVDLGFERELVESELREAEDHAVHASEATIADWWPRRAVDAHKYRAGSIFAVGGSVGMSGAIALACNAAMRAGAGLIEVTVPRSVAATVDALCVETLVHPAAETDQGGLAPTLLRGLVERAERHRAAMIGPGVGPDPDTAGLMLDLVAELSVPAVVDADGLNAASRVGRRHEFSRGSVITPHSGELARLVARDKEEIDGDRRAAVREAAADLGVVVLHKGSPTFVAAPDGRLAVVTAGGPELASAGTGDVLTGIVAALLAAGVDAFEAAIAAATVHGRAGRRVAAQRGVSGLIARDLLDEIGPVVRDLLTGDAP